MDETSSQAWLSDIVLINESRVEAHPGDVSIYRSGGEACRALEPWWVEGGYGFAFVASGDRLRLAVDSAERVVIESREATSEGKLIVLAWLASAAKSILSARKARATKRRVLRKVLLAEFEERDLLPSTIEGLIACIGFER